MVDSALFRVQGVAGQVVQALFRNFHGLLAVIVLATLTALAAGPARAADPAVAQVEMLDDALLQSMKTGATASAGSRYDALEPVVESVFDLRAMTGFAVGPSWSSFSPDDQRAAIAAFKRLTVASYVHNFRAFAGERFVVDPGVVSRGQDRIVQSQLLVPDKAPVSLVYRMRESGGAWKVIDIYFGAVSQLTLRRSDFSAPVAAGGAPALIAHMNALSEDLRR
jgi:phospholipid transport system substrate-binding protein